MFKSEVSQQRWTRYSHKKVDELINKIQHTADEQQQQEYILQANSIIIDDVPWVYLWHTRTAHISQPNLEGWLPSLMFNAEKYNQVTKK